MAVMAAAAAAAATLARGRALLRRVAMHVLVRGQPGRDSARICNTDEYLACCAPVAARLRRRQPKVMMCGHGSGGTMLEEVEDRS